MKKFTFLLAAFLTSIQSPAFGEEDTILVIGSYHPEYQWDIDYNSGLKEMLGYKYDFVYFHMNTKRLPPSEHEPMARRAWEKFLEVKPALVITGDDNALKYLAPRFSAEETPLVYLGVNGNPADYDAEGKKNITGVLERPLLVDSISIIRRIMEPPPKKILILFDDGTTSQVSVKQIFGGQTTLKIDDTVVDLKLIGQLEEWEKSVLTAKQAGYDAIFVGLFHTIVDKDGNHVSEERILKWNVDNTPVPPFAFWDFAVGPDKTIGGYVLFGHAQGEAASVLVRKILHGKSPAELPPVIGNQGQYLFSRSQLNKWGLTLPAYILSMTKYTD